MQNKKILEIRPCPILNSLHYPLFAFFRMFVLWRRNSSFSRNKPYSSLHSRHSTNRNYYSLLLGYQLRSSIRLPPFFSFQHTSYSTNNTTDNSLPQEIKIWFRCRFCSKEQERISPIGSKCEGCGNTLLKKTDYREVCWGCFCQCVDFSSNNQQPDRCLCGCERETHSSPSHGCRKY